jgi:predicted RNase H-like HicB family nuclease
MAGHTERIEAMSEYLVIYEQGTTSWGAYCPDLPGLGVVGKTRAEVERLIREGVEIHIESLREYGEPVPAPTSTAGVVVATA